MKISTADRRIRRQLAAKLRRLRKDAGLTLEEAGSRVSMHSRHWQKIEAGEVNVTLRTLVRLAALFETTPAELLDE